MNNLTERKYSLVSTALPHDTFTVVEFKGEEGLSMPYRFEVMLAAEDPELDLAKVINSPARFVIHREEKDPVYFNGILSGFEQLHAVETYVFYRAVLAPKLWWLSLTHHNQVFLDKTVPEIIEAVLTDGGLTSLDFALRLQGDYKKQEYVCQYGETHLNFVSRWLEREGLYYYFEQTESAEKLIVTDTALSHTENPRGKNLYYSPPSGLSDLHRQEIIQALLCRTGMLPRTVLLRDYNYRKPSLEVSGRAEVDPNGRGEMYLYGEHFRTPEEGNRLAGIRAQELLCRNEEYLGDSTVPYIQPGFTFELADHYRPSFNRRYLTVRMSHEGSQTGYLTAGIRKGLSDRESRVYYQNHFTAIPASVQFRPKRTAQTPRIGGVVSAKIDAAGSGQYAELDDQGRYKVKLPFDPSGRKDGKASAWLRMAQPYAGSNHGMHFPLHKDTEVLVVFTEGHPDRPVIAAAVPNPESKSPVTTSDATTAKLTTAGGNKFHMEDKEGSQRMVLRTPGSDSFIRMGSPEGGGHEGGGEGGEERGGSDEETKERLEELEEWKDEQEKKEESEGGEWDLSPGLSLATSGMVSIKAQSKNELILGWANDMYGGAEAHTVVGLYSHIVLGGLIEAHAPQKLTMAPEEAELKAVKQELVGAINKVIGNVVKLRGDVTELTTVMTSLRGTNAILAGHIQRLEVAKDDLSGKVNILEGQKDELVGHVTQLEGDKERLTGRVETLEGQKTELATQVTQLQVEKTKLANTVTEILNNSTAVVNSKVVVGTVMNNILGLESHI